MATLEGRPPFVLTVYDKALQRQGVVGRPLQLSGAIRTNAPGELTFSMDADASRVAALQADGARLRCDYRHSPKAPLIAMLSGTVGEVAGTVQGAQSTRTFTVTDDWQQLADLLGWPNPTSAITAQSASSYDTVKGPAETVARTIIQRNATRLGLPLLFPASQGRGSTITVKMRMHTMAERLVPAVAAAGVNLRLVQLDESGVTLQLTTPTVRPRTLTQRSGVVRPGGSFQLAPPTVTRIIVGAGGESTARIFRSFVRSTWEAQFGAPGKPFVRERFIDARDVGLEEGQTALTADQEAELAQRADELFAEGAPKGGLSVTLSETPSFRFGRTYLLGDRVSVQLEGAPLLSDYVREVEFSWTAEGGVELTPKVGDWTESVSQVILNAIASQARNVSNLQRSF